MRFTLRKDWSFAGEPCLGLKYTNAIKIISGEKEKSTSFFFLPFFFFFKRPTGEGEEGKGICLFYLEVVKFSQQIMRYKKCSSAQVEL